jgi:hypothetical protein
MVEHLLEFKWFIQTCICQTVLIFQKRHQLLKHGV